VGDILTRIFVTGSQGFVGNALCKHLAKEHEVLGLIHDIQSNTIFTFLPPACGVVFGDVRDFRRMREILYDYRPDAIVHLAAQAIVGQARRDPYSTFDVNVNGTAALLEAWREACPTAYFLYFSTDKVYGNGMHKKESDPVQATGIYESSKAAADIIAQAYGATVTRTCNIYGPTDQNSRIIPNTIRQCLRGEAPVFYEKAGKREYIFVDDVCKVVSKLVEAKRTGIWNIASGLVLSNEQVVLEICKHFPEIQPRREQSPPQVELDDQCFDTTKLCSSLDCLSFETFPSGIQKCVEWWRKQ